MKSLVTINKVLILTAAVLGLTLCSLVAVAQPQRGGPPPEGPPRLDRLVETLGLDEQGKSAFLAIMKQQHEKRMTIHDQYRDSREQERSAMDALHQETIEKLSAILSQQQLTQFKQFAENNRPPRPPRRR